MAGSIASLFGPSAEEIVYDRQQAEKLRQQAQLQQSLAGQETQAGRDFYQSGYNLTMGLGKALAGMFGYSEQMTDPRISKSIAMRKVFSDLSAEDLNDPSKISMLSQMADQYDLPELKLWVADRERKLLEEESTRRKRLADASAVTFKGHGLYEVPNMEGGQQGYIVESASGPPQIYLASTNAPAPKGTKKYVEPAAVPSSTKRDAEIVLQAIEQHPQLSKLNKDDKRNAANYIAGISQNKKGMNEAKAIESAIQDAINEGVFKEGELSFWGEIAKFFGADPETPIVFDRQGKAVIQTENKQQQNKTTSSVDLSQYDPNRLVQDTLDNSIWLVDGDGNPIKKVSD